MRTDKRTDTKTGHGLHSSKIFVLFYILFVLCRSVYCVCVCVCVCVCTVLQPQVGNPIAVNKYIIYMIKLTDVFRDYANASKNTLNAFQSEKCYTLGVKPCTSTSTSTSTST